MKKKKSSATRSRKTTGTGKTKTRRKKTLSLKGTEGVAAPSSITIAGVGRYTKTSCHKTKTAAKSAATSARGSGKNARLRKNPAGGYCVYTRRRAA